jgi:hypothetical protein
MARRSTVKTAVPAEVLADFNAQLVAGGFADYDGLTHWLNGRLAEEGLELRLSRSAVWRYGNEFQEQFEADMAESRQLYHVAKASLEANEDPEGVVREATIRTMQTRLLKLAVALRDAEAAGDDPHLLADTSVKISRALKGLAEADIASQKWNAEREAKVRAEERAKAAEEATAAAKDAGASEATIARIREALERGA